MEQSKKEFLTVLQGVKLSKTQNPTTAEDRKRMKVIPYAVKIILSGIRICFSIMEVTKGSS